ncbi:MAG: SDR family NAD(P)-dependent oxidoreductase [Mycobacteriales bacterium]
MKVLVTGGTGYVGSYAVKALLDAGHDVRLLVRRPERIATTVGALGVDTSALDVVVGDMVDEGAVGRAVDGMDACVHAAAVVAALDRKEAEKTIHINVDGTRNVIDAAVAAGCDPVIHVSSIAAVFRPKVDVLTSDLPPVFDAANPYTRSKAMADQLARNRQAAGDPVVIVYPGGVCGPPVGELVGEAATGLASILRIGFLAVTSGGINVIDVRDLGAIFVAALEPGRGPRRYMAGGTLVELPGIVEALRQATGRRLVAPRAPGSVYRGLGRVTDGIRRVIPFDSVFTAEGMELLTLAKDTDDSAVHDDLGVIYRDPLETLAISLKGLYTTGMLTPRQAGALAR